MAGLPLRALLAAMLVLAGGAPAYAAAVRPGPTLEAAARADARLGEIYAARGFTPLWQGNADADTRRTIALALLAREQRFAPAGVPAEKLARAMVAAAKADGEVTAVERARITAALKERGYDDSAAQVLTEELAAPLDVGRIAALASNQAEAAEIYAASLLAVDPEGAAEKGYLAMLAARLKLPADLVAHLHANAGALA